MAFPSLEEALNKVSNRYLLVVLSAKRARQLNRGAQTRVEIQAQEADQRGPGRDRRRQGRVPREGRGRDRRDERRPRRPGDHPRRHRLHRRLQGGLPAARADAGRRPRHRVPDRARARVRGAAHLPHALGPAGAHQTCSTRRATRRWSTWPWPSGRRPWWWRRPPPTCSAKAAHGIADDFLTTLLLAARCPVIMAPAMDGGMWEHPAVAANVATLRARGVVVLEPDAGALASGLSARGRLPEVDVIIEAMLSALTPARDLAGDRVVVTAGPTREPIDPVRYISNRSSGRMGYALAAAAARRGAQVTLVSGPTALAPPAGAAFVPVQTAEEMREAVLHHAERASIVIKAAAVADYRVQRPADQKIKGKRDLTLELTPNPDILAEVAARGRGGFIVGFAAETNDVVANARAKLDGQGHRPARRQRREPPRHRLRRRGQRGAADRPLGRQPGAGPDAEARGSRRHPRRDPARCAPLTRRERPSTERRSAGRAGRRPRRPRRHASLPPRPRRRERADRQRLLAVAGRGAARARSPLAGLQAVQALRGAPLDRVRLRQPRGRPGRDRRGPRRGRGRPGATVRRPRRPAPHQDAGVGEAHARRGLHLQHGQVPPARQPESRERTSWRRARRSWPSNSASSSRR